jgi:hypothetical protein
LLSKAQNRPRIARLIVYNVYCQPGWLCVVCRADTGELVPGEKVRNRKPPPRRKPVKQEVKERRLAQQRAFATKEVNDDQYASSRNAGGLGPAILLSSD